MSSKPIKPELGKIYLTRNDEYVVRVISSIGKWSKKHPIVGELCKIDGKKKIPVEGISMLYEHWTKDGWYLEKDVVSEFDLMAEVPQ